MKQEARGEALRRLQKISSEQLLDKSHTLSKILFNELKSKYSSDTVIGAFVPFEFEPIWYLAFDNTFQLAIPKLDASLMEFALCDKNFIEQHKGDYLAAQKIIEPVLVKPDVLIVPGLAFSTEGNRLGRGQGYYDRYLATHKVKTIGICFEEVILNKIPTDSWDRVVDKVITEKEDNNG